MPVSHDLQSAFFGSASPPASASADGWTIQKDRPRPSLRRFLPDRAGHWAVFAWVIGGLLWLSGCQDDPYKSSGPNAPTAARSTGPTLAEIQRRKAQPSVSVSASEAVESSDASDLSVPPIIPGMPMMPPLGAPSLGSGPLLGSPASPSNSKGTSSPLPLAKKTALGGPSSLSLSGGAELPAPSGLSKGGGLRLGDSSSLSLNLGSLSLDSASPSLGTDSSSSEAPEDPPSSQPATQPPSSAPATSQPRAASRPTDESSEEEPSSRPAAASTSSPKPSSSGSQEEKKDESPLGEEEIKLPATGLIARINSDRIEAPTFRLAFLMAKATLAARGQTYLPGPILQEIRDKTLDSLIEHGLLAQRATQKGLSVSPKDLQEGRQMFVSNLPPGQTLESFLLRVPISSQEFDKHLETQLLVQKYMKEVMNEIPLHPADIRLFYEKNFSAGEIRLRQIVVGVSENPSAEDLQKAEDKARLLLQKASESGADFAAIAKSSSDDPSASSGGDLGYLKRGDALPALEKAAFPLRVGEVAGPIKTDLGFHILQVTDRKAPLPFSQVQAKIVMELRMEKLQERLKQEASTLRRDAEIEIKAPWLPPPSRR